MKIRYANIFPRSKALFIDSVVIVAFMYFASEILMLFDEVPTYVRVLTAIFIFVLYDPIFVSQFGQTIGHSRINLVVRREDNPEKNISFLAALIRFVVKFALGWLSLLTISGSEKKQAIHDSFVKSVVIEEE